MDERTHIEQIRRNNRKSNADTSTGETTTKSTLKLFVFFLLASALLGNGMKSMPINADTLSGTYERRKTKGTSKPFHWPLARNGIRIENKYCSNQHPIFCSIKCSPLKQTIDGIWSTHFLTLFIAINLGSFCCFNNGFNNGLHALRAIYIYNIYKYI